MSKNKKTLDIARGYAFRLFISGESQKSIAAAVSVTEATVSKWVTKLGWQEKKDEQSGSTLELANSLMTAAKKMSELIIAQIGAKDTPIDSITKCSDNLVKIMASAERISKTVSKATMIDVIISLEKWLLHRAETDKELTPELLELINRYHKIYIEQINEQ